MVILGPGWLGVKRIRGMSVAPNRAVGRGGVPVWDIVWTCPPDGKLACSVLEHIAAADNLHIIVGVPNEDGRVFRVVLGSRS